MTTLCTLFSAAPERSRDDGPASPVLFGSLPDLLLHKFDWLTGAWDTSSDVARPEVAAGVEASNTFRAVFTDMVVQHDENHGTKGIGVADRFKTCTK
ncbi:hypothetical protein ACCO45_011912 [Purpureocillium lilacinum]|uniref:Uncharacterized protein n=1 Tax=Purpureocillium lilacinum TaxID=33203 RepID=A0ACC4DC75_PURLI